MKTKSNTIKKNNLIEALSSSLGVVTDACKSVNIVRSTFYKWYKEDDDFKLRVDDIQDRVLDFAESQLHQQIKDGNSTSTIFYLKTKGRKRGYIEKVENINETNQ